MAKRHAHSQTAGYMEEANIDDDCTVPFSLDHTVYLMAFTPFFQMVMHKLSIASQNNDYIFILMVLAYTIFQKQQENW